MRTTTAASERNLADDELQNGDWMEKLAWLLVRITGLSGPAFSVLRHS